MGAQFQIQTYLLTKVFIFGKVIMFEKFSMRTILNFPYLKVANLRFANIHCYGLRIFNLISSDSFRTNCSVVITEEFQEELSFVQKVETFSVSTNVVKVALYGLLGAAALIYVKCCLNFIFIWMIIQFPNHKW